MRHRASTSYNGEHIASLKHIYKSFSDKPIIEDVSLVIKPGEMVLITGPSGSGKSTILRTLAGLERPDNGEATVLGKNLYDISDKDRSRLIAKSVGVGFQSHNLDTGLTVLENLQSLAEVKGRVDTDRLGDLAIKLGLQNKLFESAASLSGGEKQRVSLGRLLVPKPEFVLLDEPTASIDPHGKGDVYQVLRDINQQRGTTFIIVSHDEIASSHVDRTIVVNSGRIVADYINQPPFRPAQTSSFGSSVV